MRKLIALILCMLLVVSMSVTAFATEITGTVTGNKSDVVKVKVTDSEGNDVEPTYNVVIDWVGLTFTLSGTVTWNVANSSYDVANGEWDTETHTITVTNNSDAAVAITANFDNGTKTSDKVNDVTASLSLKTTKDGDENLVAAEYDVDADYLVYEIKMDAVPTAVTALNYDVDTIVVTVKSAA